MAKDRVDVGDNVDAWCGRCKLDLAHTVEAVVDGWPARVVCRTCGAQHAYKPPRKLPEHPVLRRLAALRGRRSPARATASSKSGEAGRPSARKSVAPQARAPRRTLESVWAEKRDAEPEAVASATPYSPKGSFEVGMWIEHARFGLGRIEEERAGKITVLFRDAQRTLVHRR